MTRRADLSTRLSYALAWVRGKADVSPAAGIILGSGLNGLADRLERAVVIPYEEIPGFPVSKVPGHRARLVVGELPVEGGAIPVVAMQGRAHGYEGWSADDVAFVGENDDRIGPRFPDLTDAYDPALGALLAQVAAERSIPLRAGVYACLLGPSYETPAEIRMLRSLGADVVGMSTVPEVIAARHMGVRVVGISVVTNLAAGLSRRTLSHEEVAETAGRVEASLTTLVTAFLARAAR
jgi:purine-nucleoside phosphorylase